MVAHARQVFDATAADHHDRVLLQIMPFARNVRRHLEAVRQPYTSDFAQRRVRLLRRRGVDARADAALLRVTAQRGRLLFSFHGTPAVADELVDGRQIPLTRIEKTVPKPAKLSR